MPESDAQYGLHIISSQVCKLALLLFLLAGCADDIDRFIPDPVVTGDINRFFDAAREDINQSTRINIDFPAAVVTAHKTVLIFQPKSLVDLQGNLVSGIVDIEVTELMTKGEILLYGIPTSNHEKLLSSGGEFYITATQNGAPLRLRQGMQIRILTDLAGAPYDQRTELFYGKEEFNDSFQDTLYTWSEADENPNIWDNVDVTEWVALADSQQIVSGFGYESFSNNLQWISLGVFAQIPSQNKTNICVTLPDGYGNANTRVFLVFETSNRVVLLPGNSVVKQFCNFYQYDIRLQVPYGERVKLVVISEQGEDNYFFAVVPTIISRNHEIEIIPEKESLEVIKEAIWTL